MTDTWKTFRDVVYRSGLYYIQKGSRNIPKATVKDGCEFWIINKNGIQNIIRKQDYPSPMTYLREYSPVTWRWTR